MSNEIETIAIESKDSDDGYCLINACDFDKEKHKQYKGETTEQKAAKEAEKAAKAAEKADK